ncbi:hypothetical protein KR222_003731 [Zaprionus bogoriensis]|nr:hypothetical protein KR222_003731 [Zaprionus bogoriensis]
MLETKSIAALAAFNETPRKRKRETGSNPPLKSAEAAAAAATAVPAAAPAPAAAAGAAVTASCFTNAAFSSTPKRLIGRRRIAKETENLNPFNAPSGLEIKSIADLATVPEQQLPLNPFEVVRQPSKKKKREHACFENPGLNLELPERQFNPYEVVRSVATPTKCFVNAALNLRGSDAPASLNPFEIHRRSEISEVASNPAGVENPALAEEPFPTNLKIGLPFAPTLGCRIDFNGMSLSQLTPSKLLADKLVFSPVAPLSAPAKRSLGAISEESSMDIGKELDRYQLELENSINEAKLRKHGIVLETTRTEVDVELVQSPLERRIVCTTRRRTLTEIKETPEEQAQELQQPLEIVELQAESKHEPAAEAEAASEPQPEAQLEPEPEPEPELELAGGDVVYASEESEPEDEDDELDFKAPARFVRAYRPAATVGAAAATVAGSKESLQSIISSKSDKSDKSSKSNGHGVRSMIRKSIRKLMHPMQQQSEEPAEQHEQQQHHHHNNIISSIRHSLRRRPNKPQPAAEPSPADNISIVDSSERTMKLRSSVPQTEYMRIEQLTNEKKHTLRNSIRRSTRDVLRHVFHKSQDAYATAK